jgi:hypothetical protein
MGWKNDEASMTALCRTFGVSRTTGYKRVSRYYASGEEGEPDLLKDRSRRPDIRLGDA